MANQSVQISKGPSRFALAMAVFDTSQVRLLNFRFHIPNGDFSRNGSADVYVTGGQHDRVGREDFRLRGFFMPNGQETAVRNRIRFTFCYTTMESVGGEGIGYIHHIAKQTVGGNPVPNVLDLIEWGV